MDANAATHATTHATTHARATPPAPSRADAPGLPRTGAHGRRILSAVAAAAVALGGTALVAPPAEAGVVVHLRHHSQYTDACRMQNANPAATSRNPVWGNAYTWTCGVLSYSAGVPAGVGVSYQTISGIDMRAYCRAKFGMAVGLSKPADRYGWYCWR